MEAKAGGLSAQRTVLMMLLFWSLQPSPNTYPRLGGGVGRGKRRGQGLVCRQERSNVTCNSKILYLGSPQRSRVLIF